MEGDIDYSIVATSRTPWKPSLEQMELLVSHQRQLLPVSETARQLGVSVTCLEEFALRLERGRANAGIEKATILDFSGHALAGDDLPLPSGFPSMMRGR
jgi:hypothetical protein